MYRVQHAKNVIYMLFQGHRCFYLTHRSKIIHKLYNFEHLKSCYTLYIYYSPCISKLILYVIGLQYGKIKDDIDYYL